MTEASAGRLKARYRRERILILSGKAAVVVGLLFLAVLLGSVISQGWRALLSAQVSLAIELDPQVIGEGGENDLFAYEKLVTAALNVSFPDQASSRKGRKELKALVSFGAAIGLKEMVSAGEAQVGETVQAWLPLGSDAESHLKASGPADSRLSERQAAVIDRLEDQGLTRLVFNSGFFVSGDSRDPELAGIGGALMGSLFALAVTFIVTFPVAVCAAIYLELLAPRNRFFDLVEVNINNLAAVPSIIMGLLGLAVLINLVGLPRSTPLVGGLVLSMLTLPTIIIAARAAIKAVPSSRLEAALSLGATRLQGIFHHVLPSAMPGVLTGTIIGMAGALGETAPLLMIGMVAFVAAVPSGALDVATALPVQIYLWSDSPERGFVERTALAICVLLGFLLVMNAAAIYLRNRFEAFK